MISRRIYFIQLLKELGRDNFLFLSLRQNDHLLLQLYLSRYMELDSKFLREWQAELWSFRVKWHFFNTKRSLTYLSLFYYTIRLELPFRPEPLCFNCANKHCFSSVSFVLAVPPIYLLVSLAPAFFWPGSVFSLPLKLSLPLIRHTRALSECFVRICWTRLPLSLVWK